MLPPTPAPAPNADVDGVWRGREVDDEEEEREERTEMAELVMRESLVCCAGAGL